ncbi:hypothetical protein GGD56_007168 [Rhizobium mongolense]|uniref:Uncharacterized protein n=2 Tax=Rhizobium mongolense TaxID=57676 RepID=A0ABR6IZB0_9HYPH|nr:hypothetical protein [Rhizobium mongolense]TVZ75292.1 hypothetical protein BCL32_0776 [Rhizobium mongolense USDA 1844]
MGMRFVWLSRAVWDEICLDADRWYDKETGGTFMGYWAESNAAVVTAMILGGPNGVRPPFFRTSAGNMERSPVIMNSRAGWTHILATGTRTRAPSPAA